MPSVEYKPDTLIYGEEYREYEDPETGETVMRTVESDRRPFNLRISKWLERNNIYHVYGYVTATDFGIELASKSNPHDWLTTNYHTADSLTESVVSEMVGGVAAIEQSRLDDILSAGDVTPQFAEVRNEKSYRMDITIGLDGATLFDINWLAVSFDPTRGG